MHTNLWLKTVKGRHNTEGSGVNGKIIWNESYGHGVGGCELDLSCSRQ
jgi:hypothetical protein